MGRADTVTKSYLRRNDIFADVFNSYVYEGRQVLQPENLHEMDPTEILILKDHPLGDGKSDGRKDAQQRARDVLKLAEIREAGETIYVLLCGIEEQTEIHYAMPVKNGLYDFLRYSEQVKTIAEEHRKERKGANERRKGKGQSRKVSDGEFVSRFYKGDKLIPVITLVLHLGTEKWDGPLSLHDMLTIQDSRVLQFIPEYRINLIDPAQMTQGDLNKFRTSLREVLGYIKHCGNGEELLQYARSEKRMQNLERDAIAVIAETTNTKIRIPEEQEETGNMCKGIEELIEAGKTEGQMDTLVALVRSGAITIKTAAETAGLSENDFRNKMEKLATR